MREVVLLVDIWAAAAGAVEFTGAFLFRGDVTHLCVRIDRRGRRAGLLGLRRLPSFLSDNNTPLKSKIRRFRRELTIDREIKKLQNGLLRIESLSYPL